MIIQDRTKTVIARAAISILLPMSFLACSATTSIFTARNTLVEDGRPQCYIVIPEGTDGRVLENFAGRVLKAAHALAGYLKTMAGTDVPVRWETDHAPGFRIYIGSTLLAPVDPADITQEKIGFDGFIIKSVPGGVVIAGRTPLGTEHGVYHFAEQVLGIHWYTLEDPGPIIPKRSTIEIPRLDITIKAGSAWRGQYYSVVTRYLPEQSKANRFAWRTFNRLWGIRGGMAHIFDSLVKTP